MYIFHGGNRCIKRILVIRRRRVFFKSRYFQSSETRDLKNSDAPLYKSTSETSFRRQVRRVKTPPPLRPTFQLEFQTKVRSVPRLNLLCYRSKGHLPSRQGMFKCHGMCHAAIIGPSVILMVIDRLPAHHPLHCPLVVHCNPST